VEKRLVQTVVEEMKKEKTAAGSVGHFLDADTVRLASKSGTASKSSPFLEVSQVGRKCRSTFARKPGQVSQRPLRFSPFSSLQLLGFSLLFLES